MCARTSSHSFCRLLVVIGVTSGCTSRPSESLRVIDVAGAPKAAGPYAQGIVANGFVYTAGQTPRDPASGKQVEGDIAVQTNRVLDNLEAVLKGAGCTLQDVVKVTVFMTDLAEFGSMNEAFARRFGGHRPARTTVQVDRLPGNALLEIDLVARLPR
jgi:2-iminobutanoate/2-iminopropanoate deaminase